MRYDTGGIAADKLEANMVTRVSCDVTNKVTLPGTESMPMKNENQAKQMMKTLGTNVCTTYWVRTRVNSNRNDNRVNVAARLDQYHIMSVKWVFFFFFFHEQPY